MCAMKFTGLIASLMFLALSQSVSADNFFTECRFHYGAGNASGTLLNDIDYMVAWAGSSQSFNLGSFFTNCKTNNKTPVLISYIIAFTARADSGLQDCNVGTPSLCQQGANFIRYNMPKILSVYAAYAKGAEQNFGPTNKMIWCMEPDYEQYSENGQAGGGLTPAQCGTYMGEILDTIAHYAPNSVFSMDISPWKDTTFQKNWYTALNIKRFSFINTSGGQSTPSSVFISNNQTGCPTWAWVFKTFGTPMIADADYGTAGSATAFITAWQDSATLTARIKDGVIAMSHNQTPAALAPAIEAVRSKIPTPPKCPAGTLVAAPFEMKSAGPISSLSAISGKMDLIDLSGRIIDTRNIVQGNFSWDAWKSGAVRMHPGAYIVRLKVGEQILQKKVFVN
jgi:hypothetical protein